MSLQTIEREIAAAENTIRGLQQQKKDALSRKLFDCVSCNKKHMIKSCVAVQTHHYVEPYSCSGGDYWQQGEIWIICPTTQVANRVLFDNYSVPYEQRRKYDWDVEAQFQRIYTPLFKKVIETHRDNPYSWINTDYFNKNRKRFGLGTPNDKK